MIALREQTLWRRSDGGRIVTLADLARRAWIDLTSVESRAMCTSPFTLKEVANGHREPKSRGRDQAG